MCCTADEKRCITCQSVIGYKIVPNFFNEWFFGQYFNWCNVCRVDCQVYTTEVCGGELIREGLMYVCQKCGQPHIIEDIKNNPVKNILGHG